MQALEASGNRVGALQHAAVHQTLLHEEFGVGLPPDVLALSERLRREPEAPQPASSHPLAETPAEAEVAIPAQPNDEPEMAVPVQGRSVRRKRWWGAAALLAVVSLVAGVWAAWPRGAQPERSIVVLPFLNLSPEDDNEYFSDGLTEEIIARLAGVAQLKVISRTSAMHYKGSKKPLRQIADELDVAHVLEGSVRQSDGRLRVTAQLIDARTDEHLWAENYDYRMQDVFRVQEEIARQVVRALEVELGERGQRVLARQGTRDPEAYEFYRRGRFLWSTRTKEGHERALEYFQRAIARDSAYADAYSGLADVYLTSYQLRTSDRSEAEAYSRFKWAAERALALDDQSAGAHTSFAVVLWWQRNWPGAERELRRAIELNPGYATAHGWYAQLLAGMGRTDEALREIRRAYELDPFALVISSTSAWVCRLARDFDCAIEQYRRTQELNPSWAPAYSNMGLTYAQMGMHEAAIREVSKAVELDPQNSSWQADLAYVQALAGKMENARENLRRAKQQPTEAYVIARAYIALGESDSAFAWLERSSWQWPHRSPVRVDPALDPLRADPRFAQLSVRIDREMGMR
jgi:TolB-like protein/Flp pilus assembly protein TadD